MLTTASTATRQKAARDACVSSLEGRMKIAILILLLSISLVGIALAETLKYEPATVHLIGTLTSGSGMTPDQKQVLFPAIKLNAPVRLEASSNDELNETEEDVSFIQLILNQEQMEQYKSIKGKVVVITGKLTHAITGHHYTKVLITVEKIEINK